MDAGPAEFDQYILEKWDIKSDVDQHTGMKTINVTMTLSRKIVNVFMVHREEFFEEKNSPKNPDFR